MKRRLIVCADGTWNTPDETTDSGTPTPTNVSKLYNAIASEGGGIAQCAHYEPGVGTAQNFWDHWFGGGIGKGIDGHILDCYKFLIQEYAPDDDIYLFGFSRGAYTVRSLGGLIRNAGLLRREHIDHAEEAYELYRDRSDDARPKSQRATAFRLAYSYTDYADGVDSTPIECIGCWDTVGALGVPVGVLQHFNTEKYGFHDTSLSSRVRNAFHALAINERRAPFQPTLWRQPDRDATVNWLEQAWFVGVHANVGGGCADAGLSDTALLWMKDRVSRKTELQFDGEYLEKNIHSDYLNGVLENSFKGIYLGLGEYPRTPDDIDSREPDTHTWEYVHRSARARWDKVVAAHEPWDAPKFQEYVQRADAIFWDNRPDAAPPA